jgi:hypothetical protein
VYEAFLITKTTVARLGRCASGGGKKEAADDTHARVYMYMCIFREKKRSRSDIYNNNKLVETFLVCVYIFFPSRDARVNITPLREKQQMQTTTHKPAPLRTENKRKKRESVCVRFSVFSSSLFPSRQITRTRAPTLSF